MSHQAPTEITRPSESLRLCVAPLGALSSPATAVIKSLLDAHAYLRFDGELSRCDTPSTLPMSQLSKEDLFAMVLERDRSLFRSVAPHTPQIALPSQLTQCLHVLLQVTLLCRRWPANIRRHLLHRRLYRHRSRLCSALPPRVQGMTVRMPCRFNLL